MPAFQQLLLQSSGGSNTATTASFTPNAAGDALLLFVLNPGSNNAITFSSGVSTWSSPIASGINPGTAIADSLPCSAGAQTATATTSSGSLHTFGIEYSGVSAVASSTPTFQTNPGGSGAILGNAVMVPIGSVLIALCVNFDSGTNTITSPSGTNRGNGPGNVDSFQFCFTEYAGAGASITPSFTSTDLQRFSVMQALMTQSGNTGSLVLAGQQAGRILGTIIQPSQG